MSPFFLESTASNPSEGSSCCAINRHISSSVTLRCELPGTRNPRRFPESIQLQTVFGHTPNASETSPVERKTMIRSSSWENQERHRSSLPTAISRVIVRAAWNLLLPVLNEKERKKRVRGKPHALYRKSAYFFPRTREKNSFIELPSDWWEDEIKRSNSRASSQMPPLSAQRAIEMPSTFSTFIGLPLIGLGRPS